MIITIHHEGLPTNASRSITIILHHKTTSLLSQPNSLTSAQESFSRNTTIMSINALLTITPESFSRNRTIISLNTLTITQDALPHLYHKEENSSRTNMIVIQHLLMSKQNLFPPLNVPHNNQRVQYHCSRHSYSPAHTTDQPTWDKVGS